MTNSFAGLEPVERTRRTRQYGSPEALLERATGRYFTMTTTQGHADVQATGYAYVRVEVYVFPHNEFWPGRANRP
jgi:hypothetical protein